MWIINIDIVNKSNDILNIYSFGVILDCESSTQVNSFNEQYETQNSVQDIKYKMRAYYKLNCILVENW